MYYNLTRCYLTYLVTFVLQNQLLVLGLYGTKRGKSLCLILKRMLIVCLISLTY